MALTRLGPNQSINLATNTTGTLATGNGGTGSTAATLPASLINDTSIGNVTALPAGVGGKILQVQHVTFTTGGTVNTTTSFAASYITDQITPSATSSKILIQMQCRFYPYRDDTDANNVSGKIAIYRDIGGAGFSKVWPASGAGDIGIGTAASSIGGDNPTWIDVNFLQPVFFVDEPNTTSACDYTMYIAKVGTMNNIQVGQSTFPADVVLMEIAG